MHRDVHYAVAVCLTDALPALPLPPFYTPPNAEDDYTARVRVLESSALKVRVQ